MQEELSDKEIQWLIKRAHRITASETENCFKKGRRKIDKKTGEDLTPQFSEAAITYINEKATYIREDDFADQIKAYSLDFGKMGELMAIEWLEENSGMDDIVSGTHSDGEIEFRTYAGEAGGDSTDYFVINSDGEEYAVGEIKSPSNRVKACNLTTKELVDKEEFKKEYFDQFATHLVASPHAKELHYCIYNAHVNNKTGLPYNRAVVLKYKREEFQERIEQIEYRIPRVYEFILMVARMEKKASEINEWWKEQGYDRI